MDSGKLARRLTTWFGRHGRDLPWRRSPDPYRILVAEFILQQTRMETGLRYYRKFLRRFPTLEVLARAPAEEVLRVWSGLGYYSRARNLRETAVRIVRHHGGRIPADVGTLRELPGIGPYTAGAIASIAYDRAEPAIDGNQQRVLGRLIGPPNAATAKGRRRVEAASRSLLAQGSPRILNQALMDLGSAVCLPRVPRCSACPLAAQCRSRLIRRGRGGPNVRSSKRVVEQWTALVQRRGSRVWLVEPKRTGLLAGLWLPPLRRSRRTASLPHFVHVFSHRRWAVRVVASKHPPVGRGRWVDPRELDRLPHSRLTARILEAASRPKA